MGRRLHAARQLRIPYPAIKSKPNWTRSNIQLGGFSLSLFRQGYTGTIWVGSRTWDLRSGP